MAIDIDATDNDFQMLITMIIKKCLIKYHHNPGLQYIVTASSNNTEDEKVTCNTNKSKITSDQSFFKDEFKKWL